MNDSGGELWIAVSQTEVDNVDSLKLEKVGSLSIENSKLSIVDAQALSARDVGPSELSTLMKRTGEMAS